MRNLALKVNFALKETPMHSFYNGSDAWKHTLTHVTLLFWYHLIKYYELFPWAFVLLYVQLWHHVTEHSQYCAHNALAHIQKHKRLLLKELHVGGLTSDHLEKLV
jgi:hypothetical protein